MTTEDGRLESLLTEMSSSRGFILKDAHFLRSKELRISWRTKGKEMEIWVSDYLSDAPDEVLTAFARTAFDTVCRKKPGYGAEYTEWVTSDRFINEKRKIYLRRSKNLKHTHVGEFRDLTESLDRLLDSGLLTAGDIDNSVFTWTSRPNIRRLGYCSQMMRVVAVSSALDDPSVPEYVLDYVVYHEALHLRQGYVPFGRKHDREFKETERLFPEYGEAEEFLKKLSYRR